MILQMFRFYLTVFTFMYNTTTLSMNVTIVVFSDSSMSEVWWP